tara:strand:+ start:244 stop:423 length:180 start_codon:yes stop_codon:yes gene_type:complete
MIEKTITDDSTTGLKKAVVKLTLPAIEISCLKASENDLNPEIKERLLSVIGQILNKQLT